METLACEVRFEIDDSRQSPGRLKGTLITYERRAGDRPEIVARGAFYWRDGGIVINDQHKRESAILRTVPFLDGDDVKIDAPLPDTQAGRDAATNVRDGVLTGLSVEMVTEAEGRRQGLREIRRARLVRAGLVDDPSYKDSKVEVRAHGPYWQLDQEMLRWL